MSVFSVSAGTPLVKRSARFSLVGTNSTLIRPSPQGPISFTYMAKIHTSHGIDLIEEVVDSGEWIDGSGFECE